MPEPLTPDNALMIFIDLQIGSLSTIRSMDQEELKQNAIALAKVCNILQLPVIFSAAAIPGESGEFLPEMRAILSELSTQPITLGTHQSLLRQLSNLDEKS
jgi:nicotinamidase-related amidase